MTSFDWTPIRYRNVIAVLKNPFYAGAYAYGKSETRLAIVDGRARKTYGHGKPLELGGPAEGPPRGLHRLGHPGGTGRSLPPCLRQARRPEVEPRRARAARRRSRLRALRPAPGGVLPAGRQARSIVATSRN